MEIPNNPNTNKQSKKNTVITLGAGAGAGAIAIAIGSFVVVSALNFRRTKQTPSPPPADEDEDEDESNDLGKKKKKNKGLHSLLHDPPPLLSHHRIDGTRSTSVTQIDSTSIGNNESSILEREFSVWAEADDTHVVNLNKNTEDPFAVVQVIEEIVIESLPLKNLVEGEERPEFVDEKDISAHEEGSEAEQIGVEDSRELVLLVEEENAEENKDFDKEIIDKVEEEEATHIEESHGDDKHISGEGNGNGNGNVETIQIDDNRVELGENIQIQLLVEKDAQQEDNGDADADEEQIEVESNPEMQLVDADEDKDKENTAEIGEEKKTQMQLVEETGQQDEYDGDQEKSEEESLEIAELEEDKNPEEMYLVETGHQVKTSESSEEEVTEIAADVNLVQNKDDKREYDDNEKTSEQIAIERSPDTYLVDTVEIVQMNLVANEEHHEEEDEEDDIDNDDDDEDEEDQKGEENSSEGTGDSSMESNSEAIWPSEVIITHEFTHLEFKETNIKYPEAEKIEEDYSESESEEEEIEEQGKSLLVKPNKGRIWSWSSMVVLLLVVVPVLLSLALTQSMKLGLVAFFIVLLSQFTKLHKLT